MQDWNMALDDPAEVIFDIDFALRPDDTIYGPGDMVEAHLTSTDIGAAQTPPGNRLSTLVPHALGTGSSIKDRFTTVTNQLRYTPFPHQLGPNLISDGGTGDGWSTLLGMVGRTPTVMDFWNFHHGSVQSHPALPKIRIDRSCAYS
ncbi:MAG: hypothetical protein R3C20_03145 [Planctomycetaceae bacterium]